MYFTKILSLLLIFLPLLLGCSDDDENISYDASTLNNVQPLGSSATDLLTDSFYTKLTVEVVSVMGYEPTAKALVEFQKFLAKRLYKPDGITIKQRSVRSSGLSVLTIDSIRKLESMQRNFYTKDNELVVYIYFSDTKNPKDDNTLNITLGAAYLNTSIVIYEKTLRELSRNPNTPRLSTIETAALNHEFSHLLGLINTDHKENSITKKENTGGHCETKNCLMASKIEFGSGMMEVLGLGVPELDSLCLASLKERGGR